MAACFHIRIAILLAAIFEDFLSHMEAKFGLSHRQITAEDRTETRRFAGQYCTFFLQELCVWSALLACLKQQNLTTIASDFCVFREIKTAGFFGRRERKAAAKKGGELRVQGYFSGRSCSLPEEVFERIYAKKAVSICLFFCRKKCLF